jgi:beta-glucosidase
MMAAFFRNGFTLLSLIGFAPYLYAQIAISGMVKDGSGKAISGATVSLSVAKKFGMTDANGAYSISGTSVFPLKAAKNLCIGTPSLFRNKVYFGVPADGMNVRMDVFATSGRRCAAIFNRVLLQGNYRFDPVFPLLSLQVYFLKIQVGGSSSVVKLPLVEKCPAGGALRKLDGEDVLGFFRKTAAAVDTLTASAPTYKMAARAIDSYAGTYDFVLEKAPFSLAAPANGSMQCESRKVQLSWNPSAAAARYEVWLNTWHPPYDNDFWMTPGSLLDRYTKVGELTGTTFTTDDLPDRWTYKWYVVAVDAAGSKTQSDVRQFGVYLPVLEQVDDGVGIVNGCRDINKNGAIEPFENWKLPVETRVADLIGRMTKEQKALQRVYDGNGANEAGWTYFWPLSAEEIVTNFKKAMATPWGIPFITAGDQVHGYKITYPAEPALAAARNFDIVYKCGDLQRRCHRAISAYGNLAPLSEVGTCVFYDRVQEGCGEDGDVAAGVVRAIVAGYHGGPELNPRSMVETLKHWPSQGAGGEGSVQYDAVTIKYHMKPWQAAMDAGVVNIMPGYATCPFLASAGPGGGAGDNAGIIGYLRNTLKYDGVITTDWLPSSACGNAAIAGSDVMGGNGPAVTGTLESVCSDAEMDASARRILTIKFKTGMFENPYPPYTTNQAADAYWQQLRAEGIHVEAARQSLTLLKNNGVLPLKLASGDNIVVGGPLAESENCTYAWYSGWNNGSVHFFDAIKTRAQKAGVTASLTTAANPKVAICFVGEKTYTHRTEWGAQNAFLPADQLSVLQGYKTAGTKLVVVYILPRPYVITWEAQNADAIVAAYRCGDGGPQAIAEMLFGDFAPRGKLAWQMPKTLDQMKADVVDVPFDMGATAAQITEIRSKIDKNERVEPVYGDPQYQEGFGLTW